MFTVLSLIILMLVLPLIVGAVVDLRDKTLVFDSGSSKVAVGLTALQAQAAFSDPSATGGWYQPSYQVESQIGPDRDTEEVKDEADTLIKSRINRDEFVLITTFFQTDDALLNLMDYLEETANAVPLRYPLPTQLASTVEEQWLFMYNTNVRRENWRISAQNQADRTRQVTFVGTKDPTERIRVIVTLPASQVDAAWTPYPEFLDTALP